MKTMSVTAFKARALQIMKDVSKTKEPVRVTRHGKPIAEVVPCSGKRPSPGLLADTLVYEKNLVDPVADKDWEAAE